MARRDIYVVIALVALALSLIHCEQGLADPLTGHPLSPVDTSGPRATLRSFIMNVDRATAELQASGYRTGSALKHIRWAASTLDLREIPLAIREDKSFEATLRLRDVLNNIEIPPLESIPSGEDFKDTENPSWRIPHTDITIAPITEGHRKGAWLFTAQTVDHIKDYYSIVKDLRDMGKDSGWVYEKYHNSPGWMIPGVLIEHLPLLMRTSFFEQALWQWISLVLSLVVGVFLLIWTRRILKWLQKKVDSDARRWRWERIVYPLFGVILSIFLLYFIDVQINITGYVLTVARLCMEASAVVFISWAIITCGSICIEGLTSIKQIESSSIAGDVLSLTIRILSYIGVFILLYLTAERFGLPVGAIFASAGIAGFAVAFAAKDSLSNLFGGLTIFMDRPFKRGDYIILDTGDRGEVVQIGMRSTRVQTRDDVMFSIPNSIITNATIINQSSPKQMFRVRIKIGVAYGSDIQLVEEILIRQVISNPLAAKQPEPRVRFRSFGDSALEFELLCWAQRPHDQGRLMHELNSGIYNAFSHEGIEIPYPQRTIHLNETNARKEN